MARESACSPSEGGAAGDSDGLPSDGGIVLISPQLEKPAENGFARPKTKESMENVLISRQTEALLENMLVAPLPEIVLLRRCPGISGGPWSESVAVSFEIAPRLICCIRQLSGKLLVFFLAS